MITTAKQAFTFAAGSVGSQETPETAIFAFVFRGFADLCDDIPCELPRADVVAFALIRLGATDGVPTDSQEGKRRLIWHEVGHLLKARIEEAPKSCEKHDLRWCDKRHGSAVCINCGEHDPYVGLGHIIPDAAIKCRWCAGDETPDDPIHGLMHPSHLFEGADGETPRCRYCGRVDLDLTRLCGASPYVLGSAIWLWQMLATACESRIGAMPPVRQDQRTGRLAIADGLIMRPISQLDFRAMQQHHAQLNAMLGGLRQDLKMLIEGLCPERTAEIRRIEAEQVAKLQAQQQEAIDAAKELEDKPRLTIVKD